MVAWLGLLAQYYLIVRGTSGAGFAAQTVTYFSYFTILSNLLAAISFSAPMAAPDSPLGSFFARPSVRTAVTLYLCVTSATYMAVLQGLWRPQGLQLIADVTLHYIVPALALLDWIIFTPKGALRGRSILPWLAFPLAFGIYTIARGPLAGFYPYPFLNVDRLGIGRVLVNMTVMSAVFAGLGLMLVLVGRLLARRA